MKLAMLSWIFVASIGIYSFLQFQTVNELREQVSLGEKYSSNLSIQIREFAQERLHLLNQIAELEDQLAIAREALATSSDPTTTLPSHDSDQNNGGLLNLVEERFVDIGNDEYLLNVPEDRSISSEWRTVDQLRSSIDRLDEELGLTLNEQEAEFRAVDLTAYEMFLEEIDLDEASKQNILAQLIDSNREGFRRMLHHSVELQVNGYAAWAINANRGDGNLDGYFDFITENSPTAVMGRNLDAMQLQKFYQFEAERQSQREDSPDYIAELVYRLGL